jgi:hypothetical protein
MLKSRNDGPKQESFWRTPGASRRHGGAAFPSGVDAQLLAGVDVSGCVRRLSAGDHPVPYEVRPKALGATGVCRTNCRERVESKDHLVALGLLVIFFVYKENTFASATIELAPEQKVISTGLYALVRHPMYMGAFFLLVGIPLSLGSWWGLLVIALMMPALIWRLFDEEKLLAKNLPGYSEYRNKVRYRLVPFIW